jgi:U3 small nucleolar RNA-associated protein 20
VNWPNISSVGADAYALCIAVLAEPSRSQAVRIADAVEAKLLPSLLQYLEQKDETEDSIRLPIAIGIVKVALNLPESTRDAQISRLLTTLSQVFRSKSQETRDLAKETIIKITVILGPSWLSSVVQEMKASLQRGPQLHILAFVIHAILVHVTALASADFSDLDDCVANVVAIAGEVVFGESGKDLQADGFKTKMREVRSSTAKGLDTFQLVARLVSPGKLKAMLLPVREILQTTQVLRVLQQVDDVLRRISTGLNSNERVTPGDMLVLCHTLVGQNSQFLKAKAKSTRLEADKVTAAAKNFHVDMKRVVKKEADHYAANAQKFVAFGLELFVTGFRRGHFNFADAEILARLDPLVNVIGNTLYAADSGVVIAGLKATGSLVKCPLESLPAAIPALVQQVFVVIKQSGGTDSEVCQAALKTLAVIMRDCKTVEVSPKQLKYILDLITPDMEDPARQSTLFTILRAIISRRFVLADIYDIMDRVAELMVTGSSTQVQELCRVTLLQFLLDYPQGKGRLKKQMQFLAKNLAYTYESGRLSVMELISAVLNKFSLELIREYSDLFLVALVMVIANDDSIKCREFAAELVRSLFQRMDEDQRSKSVATLHAWAETSSQAQLPRLAAQVYGLFVDALKMDASPFVSMILLDLQAMLATSAVTLEAFETAQDEPSPFGMEIEDELDWQLPYQALNSLAKVLHVLPERVSSVEWQPIVGHMLFPHAWVRLASSRLLGTLFGTSPPSFDRAHASAADVGPLQPRGLFDIARKSLLQLKGESIDEGLSMQVVKNMVYLGRCFALGPSKANAAFPAAVIELLDDAAPVDPYAEAEAEEEEEEEAPEEAPVDVDEEVSEEVAVTRALSNPLAWLFTKLSQTARHILITRPAIHGEVSVSVFFLLRLLSPRLTGRRSVSCAST